MLKKWITNIFNFTDKSRIDGTFLPQFMRLWYFLCD